MAYNVFIDSPVDGRNIAYFDTDNPYDASALAHAFSDAGYRVQHDLWGAQIDDAMISPLVWSQFRLERFPALLLTPSDCYALHASPLN